MKKKDSDYPNGGLINRIKIYLRDRATMEEKVFWHIVPLCTVVAVFSVIMSFVEGLGFVAAGAVSISLISFILLMYLCYRKGNSSSYYVAFCLIMNCLLMPAAFLTNGGPVSGMPLYCLGALSFCAFCTEKKNRIITFSISFAVQIMVFLLAILVPDSVIEVREGFIRYDILISFPIAALSLFLIISLTLHQLAFQKNLNTGVADSLGSLIEFRSVETGDHGKEMKDLMEILLSHANKAIPGVYFSKMDIHMISSASMLHDIGKIAVPERILNKPGKLTDEEFEIVKRHPVDGSMMIESMRDYQNPTYYGYCYEICRHHHERYDGSGYPDHLKGNDIPLVSQLASLADMIEALTTKRSYKETYAPEKAYDVVLSENGTHFSPQVIDCFRSAWPEIMELLTLNKKVG